MYAPAQPCAKEEGKGKEFNVWGVTWFWGGKGVFWGRLALQRVVACCAVSWGHKKPRVLVIPQKGSESTQILLHQPPNRSAMRHRLG